MIGESQSATWTCIASPCPWGSSLSNQVLAWPASAEPVAARLGYTSSPAAYLPAGRANGLTIELESGSAGVFAGEPQAPSHRYLASVSAGESYLVSGLADGEVLSVQSDVSFDYRVTAPEPPLAASASQAVTWACTGSPCPWGDASSAQAVVWPAETAAGRVRLGYTASDGVYLPAAWANGTDVSIESGEASAFAGAPGDNSHRVLGSISAGQTLHVSGLVAGEVLSVQASAAFTYRATLPAAPSDPVDPADAIASTHARWRCNVPGCTSDDWIGEVIAWPSWAAYQTNARSGDQSRSVFAEDGAPLYPYMGSWAQGCEITCVSGTVLIIEWQRGTDVWRGIPLQPGQSHVIDLMAPEDGAMIETFDGMPGFRVTLRNCTPQPLSPPP